MTVELRGMKTSSEHAGSSFSGYPMLGLILALLVLVIWNVAGNVPMDGADKAAKLTFVGLLVLIAVVGFALIRFSQAPSRDGRESRFAGSNLAQGWYTLFFEFGLLYSVLILRGVRAAEGTLPYPDGAFVSSAWWAVRGGSRRFAAAVAKRKNSPPSESRDGTRRGKSGRVPWVPRFGKRGVARGAHPGTRGVGPRHGASGALARARSRARRALARHRPNVGAHGPRLYPSLPV